MGSVRDLYTTGDNDPEIHPRSYYRHYLYCDGCGSFELEPWVQTENRAEGLLAWRSALGSKIETLGLRCRRCQATYAYGTPFFTDLDANPLGLTVDEVPRPKGVTPFEIGADVPTSPPEAPSSRLPP